MHHGLREDGRPCMKVLRYSVNNSSKTVSTLVSAAVRVPNRNIVNSRFLQRPQKRSHENQHIHRRLSQKIYRQGVRSRVSSGVTTPGQLRAVHGLNLFLPGVLCISITSNEVFRFKTVMSIFKDIGPNYSI